jgi:hypothetical protein
MITIKSTSGATYDLADVRWEVRDEIEKAIWEGRASGEVECGGQTYAWTPKEELCGYCMGAGRVPMPLYDREGRRRTDWPETRCCEYCYGTGQCEEGHKLLPASRPKVD